MMQAEASGQPLTILLLEGSDFDAELIQERLHQLQPEPRIVRLLGRTDYVNALEEGGFDLILSDYSLPGFGGVAALKLAARKAPATPFIFVTGVLDEDVAIESLRNGATDYVLKQRLPLLPSAVMRALAETWQKAERRRIEEQMQLLVAERRRIEEQMRLLVAELSHRVKNTLAAVISIARNTGKRFETADEYKEALVSRLRALSDAHSLVFEANWRETKLDQILKRSVDPFRLDAERHVTLTGPPVKLGPKTALALSLIFHELVANAVKYGSLSREKGQVTAEWLTAPSNGDAENVKLIWTESGGPRVMPPQRVGFGTALIEGSARYELDGEAVLRYPETGFVCELRFSALSS